MSISLTSALRSMNISEICKDLLEKDLRNLHFSKCREKVRDADYLSHTQKIEVMSVINSLISSICANNSGNGQMRMTD